MRASANYKRQAVLGRQRFCWEPNNAGSQQNLFSPSVGRRHGDKATLHRRACSDPQTVSAQVDRAQW